MSKINIGLGTYAKKNNFMEKSKKEYLLPR
jgi:hypothetical protein